MAEIRDALRNSREDVILGIFSVPWREEDFDDAIHKIIAQDFTALAPYVDVFSPMVYHGLCGKPLDWIGEITTYMKEKTNKEVWPIVQAMDEPKEMKPGELKEALQIGLEASSRGVIFFTIDHVVANERKLGEVREVYKGG